MADGNLAKIAKDLPFPPSEYNMTVENKSSFLDIGSGFGKPVFHAAMQTGCKSYGVEIVPARIAFSQDQKYEFVDHYGKKCEKKEKHVPPSRRQSQRKRDNATTP